MAALDKLKNKDLVFLMGATGSGKSTIANATVQGVDRMAEDSEEEDIIAKETLELDNRQMFKIGKFMESCTRTPGYFWIGDKLLVDAPGFTDSNSLHEYPNQSIVHWLIMNAKSISIIIVTSATDIESQRGRDYLRLLTSIVRMLSKRGLEH